MNYLFYRIYSYSFSHVLFPKGDERRSYPWVTCLLIRELDARRHSKLVLIRICVIKYVR